VPIYWTVAAILVVVVLDEAALGVGRQIVKQVVRAWLGVRRAEADRNSELVDLVAVSVTDSFHRRKLLRQLEDIGDHSAARLKPLYEHEFRRLPENERLAALQALTDTLAAADLGDRALFDADADPIKVAMAVRRRVPKAAADAFLSEDATAFYDALLDASCIALVRIVRELPAFQPRAMVELLGRTSQIADQLGDVLARLPRTSLTAPSGTTHDDEFGERYLRLVGDSLDDLELFGVDIRRYRLRTRVSVAYLSLTVSGRPGAGRGRRYPLDDRWFSDRRHDDASSMRVEAALAERPWTLLRGEAGSGKTTLLQWLAVSCARGGFTGGLSGWNDRTPFLIRLRSYPDGTLPRPEEFLDGVAGPLVGLMPGGWVHRRLDDSALLLVDGVDELAPRQRQKVRRWLRDLRNGHPELPIVVTSRPSAAAQSWLTDIGFESVLLEPMGPSDVTAFCARWHAAVRDAGRQDPACMPCSEAELASYETALLRHLDNRRDLRALASNPLLCAMLCALNLDRRRQLPPDRMALYEAALNLLIERRDAEREVPAAQEIQLATRSKLAILQRLAWNLTLAGRVELALDEAEELAATAIEHLPNITADPAKVTDPAAVTQYLLDRSGVIRKPAEGRVDFVHRTFQEYLAAKQATDEHLVDVLVRQSHSDQWRETVIMAAGHGTIRQRQRLLNGILDRADAEPKHTRRLRLLAAACLEVGTIDPDTTERIDTGLGAIIPPRNSRESRSLALGGDRALRNLPSSLDDLSEPEAAACVRTAALVNGPAALRLIAGYAPDPRWRVQQEIAEAWRYFDAEEYAGKVLTNAPLQDGKIKVKRPEHVRYASRLSQLTALHGTLGEVDDLAFLADARRLKSLSLRPTRTVDVRALNIHDELYEIYIFGPCAGFEGLAHLPQVEDLGLSLSKVESIDFISQVSGVQYLYLYDAGRLTSLHALTRLESLAHIYLSKLELDPVPTISALSQTFSIFVNRIPGRAGLLRDIVAARPTLTRFGISGIDLTSIAELKSMPGLVLLGLESCPVSDIDVLAGLRELTFVHLSGTKVTNLRPLTALPELRLLDLRGCPPELDLSPLSALPRRVEVRLDRGQHVLGLDAARPRVRIKRV
jgi:Leucine-rich repeat (LRR) protein